MPIATHRTVVPHHINVQHHSIVQPRINVLNMQDLVSSVQGKVDQFSDNSQPSSEEENMRIDAPDQEDHSCLLSEDEDQRNMGFDIPAQDNHSHLVLKDASSQDPESFLPNGPEHGDLPHSWLLACR